MLLSAVSDLEVENEERDGTMWHILYPFSDGPQPDANGAPMKGMHIATTRPETMLADGALAVHPDDERYKHLIGKLVDLPLCDRGSRSSPTTSSTASSARAASRSPARTTSTTTPARCATAFR